MFGGELPQKKQGKNTSEQRSPLYQINITFNDIGPWKVNINLVFKQDGTPITFHGSP